MTCNVVDHCLNINDATTSAISLKKIACDGFVERLRRVEVITQPTFSGEMGKVNVWRRIRYEFPVYHVEYEWFRQVCLVLIESEEYVSGP